MRRIFVTICDDGNGEARPGPLTSTYGDLMRWAVSRGASDITQLDRKTFKPSELFHNLPIESKIERVIEGKYGELYIDMLVPDNVDMLDGGGDDAVIVKTPEQTQSG